MAKRRTGLHKEISSIFSGVALPGNKTKRDQNDPQTPDNDAGSNYTPTAPDANINEPKKEIPQPKWPQPQHEQQTSTAVSAPPEPLPTPLSPPPKVPEPTPEPVKPKPEAKKTFSAPKKKDSVIQKQLNDLFLIIKQKVLTPKPGVDPKRHMATLVLMPVLFIILISVFAKTFASKKPETPKTQTAQATNTVVASAGTLNWTKPQLYPEVIRDPMTLGETATIDEKNIAGPVVNGIVYNEANPMVIIGTAILGEGEVVDGVTIKKINFDSVEFEHNGKTWTRQVGER